MANLNLCSIYITSSYVSRNKFWQFSTQKKIVKKMHALLPAGSTSHTASMVSPTGFSTIISYCPEWALELNCRMVRVACWVKPPSTVIMIPFWGRSRVPLCLHSTPLIPTPWNWAVRVMDSAGAGYTALSEELTSAGTAQDREDSTVTPKLSTLWERLSHKWKWDGGKLQTKTAQ